MIEDAVLKRRLRRPGDLARFASAILAIVVVTLLGFIAQSTTSGIDQDITHGAHRLPSVLLVAASLVSGFGALMLPAIATADLVVRRRTRQLIESIGAFLASIIFLTVAGWAITKFGNDRFIAVFAGSAKNVDTVPFNIMLGGLAGFSTVARLMSRF